ncbi:DnaD domain-containing protein [Peribacillus frigoritolerans]|uniref:DnaD domain-containing protein n=1 Tax=Peribacillus frigoritolerans TaxID=450367 RepID=UPI003D043EE2
MAKYRQVHTTFWNDAFVLDLTPEEKYFYLYLMTNDKTTQCGIYELPKRVIEMHTGYNRETVEKLLQRFVEYDKIIYNDSTKEIMMINWVKYNFINSPKVKKCIEKELELVKHLDFKKQFLNSLTKYGYRIDTVSIDLGEEEEKEKEKEEEEEKNNNADAVVFYQDNFGVISPFVVESITDWEKDLTPETVIEAMKRALSQNKRTWSYIEAILKNWNSLNLRTINDVLSYELNRKGGGQAGEINSGNFSSTKRETSLTGGKSGRLRKADDVQEVPGHESDYL